MAHLAKFCRPEFGKMYAHWAREKDKDGNYVTYQTEDEVGGHIHRERTHLNYTIGDIHTKSWYITRTQHVYQKPNQKRPIVACDIVVTLPRSEEQSKENIKNFFQAAYDSLINQYGQNDNVIGCWVHLDESQPHMHFAFLPISARESKQKPEYKEKLSTRAYWPRKNSLQQMHRTLQKDIDAVMGRHVDVLTGVTQANGGNKTVTQLKSETQKQHDYINERQKYIEKYASDKEEIKKLVGERKNPLMGEEYYRLSPHIYERLRTLAKLSVDQQEQYDLVLAENTRLKAENTRLNTENQQMHERVIRYQHEQADKYKQQITDAEAERFGIQLAAEKYLTVPKHQRKNVDTMIDMLCTAYQHTVSLVAIAAVKTLEHTNNLSKSVKILAPVLKDMGIDSEDHMQWCLRARRAALHPDQYQQQSQPQWSNDVSKIPNYHHANLSQDDWQTLNMTLSPAGASIIQAIIDENGGAWSRVSELEKDRRNEHDRRQAQR